MITLRFRQLMTEGYGFANKWYFKEFNESEFQNWVQDCRNLLSRCEPEPYFPRFPDHGDIEEIVFLLAMTSSRISKGKIEYIGLL